MRRIELATVNHPIHAGPELPASGGVRREPREDTIRIVEYARFPRAAAGERTRLGFTRYLSRSGMCIGVTRDERVGALLKVCVRAVDGHRPEPVVARVVWTSAEPDGRFWLGLELVSDALGCELAA
jgi:hypothetical protein